MQWKYNTGSGFANVPTNTGVYSGYNTGTLTITGITSAMSGYSYEAVFTNSHGSATVRGLPFDRQTAQPADLSADSPLTDGSLLLPADVGRAELRERRGHRPGAALGGTMLSPTDGSGHALTERHRQRHDGRPVEQRKLR